MAVGASPVEDAAGGAGAALLILRDAASSLATVPYRNGLQRLTHAASKPVAAVRDPPAHIHDRNGCCQGPPERQDEIRDEPKYREADPEDLSLHSDILAPAFLSRGKRIKRCDDFS